MPRTAPPPRTSDLEALLAPAKPVASYLADFLRRRPLPANLTAAIEYAALGSGKMIRPVLVVQACRAVGGSVAEAYPPAAAVELVHAFSLVHDDLPAMDDDDLRRGRPTLHKHTNEAMAILAGDAMLGLAFELLASKVTDCTLCMALVRELAVGTNDMIAGQVYDTLPDSDDDAEDLDRLRRIHRHKTGALLRASVRMGALIGGAGARELAAMSRYADAIGLMFQAVDDLLDVTQPAEAVGKATHKDHEQGKLTYPGLLGIEGTRVEIDRLLTDANEVLDELGEAANPLRDLAAYLAVREK